MKTNQLIIRSVLTTAAFLWINASFSQDVIYKKDKTQIKAKITEITEAVIKYKRYIEPDGETYSISSNKVYKIVYENGEEEMIQSATQNELKPEKKSAYYEKPEKTTSYSEKEHNSLESSKSSAISGIQFFVGADVVNPLNKEFSDLFSVGGYGKVGVEKKFLPNVAGTAQIGYGIFTGKTVSYYGEDYKESSLQLLDVSIGVRYYVASQFSLGANIGYGHFSQKDSDGFGGLEIKPSIGYEIGKIALSAYYTTISVEEGSSSFIGLGVAYKF